MTHMHRARLMKRFVTVYRVLQSIAAIVILTVSIRPGLGQRNAPYEELRRVQAADELERRVTVLEGMSIDHRITILETVAAHQEDSQRLLQVGTGASGLLVIEALYRAMNRAKKVNP